MCNVFFYTNGSKNPLLQIISISVSKNNDARKFPSLHIDFLFEELIVMILESEEKCEVIHLKSLECVT